MVPTDIHGTTAQHEQEKGRVEDSAKEAGEAKDRGLVWRIIGQASAWGDRWKELAQALEEDPVPE